MRRAHLLDTALRGARWVQRSLILKITLPTVLLVLALSLVSALVLGWSFARTHEIHSERRADRFSGVIEDALRRDTDSGHADLGPFLKLLCRATYKSAFVMDRDGRVRFTCSDDLRSTTLTAAERSQLRVFRDGTTWVRRVRAIAGGPSCAGCHGVTDPVGYVGVDSRVEEAEAEVREQQRVNLVAGTILAVSLSAVLIVVHLVLVHRPLRRLTTTVGQIRAGDLAARAPVSSSGDEMSRLGQRLNDMAMSVERAKLELDRTHRAELAQSTKLAALGQMVSTVAHEIKNPLTGIVGALRVLESDVAVPTPARTVIGKILAQMERLSHTVVAALDFARPIRPAVTQVDLVDLLERAIFFVEGQAAEQRVQLVKHYALRVAYARVDPDLMKQVFLNLLLNGIQAMPRGGVLAVGIRSTRVGTVQVTISDQGPGISVEHLDRLFSPFFSTKPGGTGLGLLVARQIVETHGGQIRIDSLPGQGASFTVQLPAEEARAHVAS